LPGVKLPTNSVFGSRISPTGSLEMMMGGGAAAVCGEEAEEGGGRRMEGSKVD